jgi:hypothetical protein
LIISLLAFIFQSSVSEIQQQQFLINCPYPLFNAVAGNITIVNNVVVKYDSTLGTANQTDKGSFFQCYDDPVSSGFQPTVNLKLKPYGVPLFSTVICGWCAWAGDTITVFFEKAQPFLTLIYLLVQAPTIVSGMSWWTYVNAVLITFIALGIFMAFKFGG